MGFRIEGFDTQGLANVGGHDTSTRSRGRILLLVSVQTLCLSSPGGAVCPNYLISLTRYEDWCASCLCFLVYILRFYRRRPSTGSRSVLRLSHAATMVSLKVFAPFARLGS